MDVLLPVFQLVYFVSHFLYSLAQSVVLTWHLLTTIIPFHRLRPHFAATHPTPDNGKGLAKTPRHLGIILGMTSPSVASVAALVVHAASYGVRYVSVYDIVGDLQLRKSEVMQHVRNAAGSVYDFKESGDSESEAEAATETSVYATSVDGAVRELRHRNSEIAGCVEESNVMEGVWKAAGSEGECKKAKEEGFEQKSCEKLPATNSKTLESERAETCPGNCGKVPESSPKLPECSRSSDGLKQDSPKLPEHSRSTVEPSEDPPSHSKLPERSRSSDRLKQDSAKLPEHSRSSDRLKQDSPKLPEHSTSQESLPRGSSKLPEPSRSIPECSDRRPLVTIQFLGLKDGRQKLAVTAEKLARRYTSEYRTEGRLDTLGEAGESLSGGRSKTITERSKGSESWKSGGNSFRNSSYKFGTRENLASGSESSEMELRKRKKGSLESSEGLGISGNGKSGSESYPSKFESSESRAFCSEGSYVELRKRGYESAESSESSDSGGKSSENPSYKFSSENPAFGGESSLVELRKRGYKSAESSESSESGGKSSEIPSYKFSSENQAFGDESSLVKLRKRGYESAESSESSESGGKSSRNPSYKFNSSKNQAFESEGSNMELVQQSECSLGCPESSESSQSGGTSPEKCSFKLGTSRSLTCRGASPLKIVPSLNHSNNSNISSVGLCKGPEPTPTHSIGLRSSLDTPTPHPNQFKAKINDSSRSPEPSDFLEISPKPSKNSNISLGSSLSLCREAGHIPRHPIGLPTAKDITEEVSLGLPDPELLITLGLNSTLGYPPWLLRTSEIHFIDVSEGVTGLRKVMEAYAGCEQRWGR